MLQQASNKDSKEMIKARMLHHAAVLWGVKNPQTLDPFVKLLVEAFATEIFRVSNETGQIESRIVEKVARLLTPSIYTVPQPAHAIAYALPTEPTAVMISEREFLHSVMLPASEKGASETAVAINFTPVDSVELAQINIACIATGYGCKWFDEKMNPAAFRQTTSIPIPYGEMWLGVDVGCFESTLPQRISLYFANQPYEYINWLYQLLPFVKASIADVSLDVLPGRSYIPKTPGSGYEEIFNDFDIQKRIADQIKLQYDRHFITLEGFPDQIQNYVTECPEVLRSYFTPQDIAAAFQKPCLWLRMKFPPQYTYEILEQFTISLNAFPIINRKWEQKNYTLGPTGNHIPIAPPFGACFLSVQKVQDDNGRYYTEIPYGGINNLQTGHYSIKKGGMERYDKRSALDIGNYILELARDEITAFGDLVSGNSKDPVKDIVIHLQRLERTLREMKRSVREVPTYIVAEPLEGANNITAGYWITHGKLANNLRVSHTMAAENGVPIAHNTIILLTATRGGGEPQTGTDSINAYRYALTSRDRIVTFLDIKNFCHYELNEAVKDIQVKKGTALSPKPKEGFVRTTDIFITVKEHDTYLDHYWETKSQELLQKINNRAVDGIMRRIFITPEKQSQQS